MDNEKQQGQQSGQQNPSQKDPRKLPGKDNQQQRGGTQQDPSVSRPGWIHPQPGSAEIKKDKKIIQSQGLVPRPPVLKSILVIQVAAPK
jgi:hypothetical protein